MWPIPYKSLFILCAALGLCAGCGVRGALSPAEKNTAAAPAPANAVVLVGADGKAVTIPEKQATPNTVNKSK